MLTNEGNTEGIRQLAGPVSTDSRSFECDEMGIVRFIRKL